MIVLSSHSRMHTFLIPRFLLCKIEILLFCYCLVQLCCGLINCSWPATVEVDIGMLGVIAIILVNESSVANSALISVMVRGHYLLDGLVRCFLLFLNLFVFADKFASDFSTPWFFSVFTHHALGEDKVDNKRS